MAGPGPTASVVTIGCRLNQSESDALRARLHAQGITVVADPARADVCYVNTCAVTAAAERSSVKHVRRACSLSPRPRVVALGCMAAVAPERLRAIDGVAEVWSNEHKQAALGQAVPAPERSRPVLKIQDGCNAGCAYCLPGRLRGRPRSVPATEVAGQFRRLLDSGFAEVVLTGLNLALYEGGLGRLLADLLKLPGRFRIRLASVEPAVFDAALLAAVSDDRICPHFHVPLQSADDGVLTAMGRQYSVGQAADLLGRLKRVRPEANVGADIIAGFPAEDDAAFERGLARLETTAVDYLHVFPYSRRPGTRAATQGDPVPSAVKRERAGRLRRFSDRRRSEYAARFVGTERVVVVEPGGFGLTDNYLRVKLEGGAAWPRPGRLARVLVNQKADVLCGRLETSGAAVKEAT